MEKFRYVPKEKIAKMPHTTGVYAFRSGNQILYIGKAVNLKDRIKNHFFQPSYRDNLFIYKVSAIGYIETNSEIEALLLEANLIKQYNPKYNVMWKDGKNYFYVAITKEDCPRIFITHQPAKSGFAASRQADLSEPRDERKRIFRGQSPIFIGPFTDGKALKRTLRMLRRVFPYYTVRKHSPRPCQYCHLRLCPGPNPDKKEYRKNIKNLLAVLEGKKPAVLKKLQREMNKTSKNQEYEKAGKLRDQIQDLEIIFSHARVLRPAEAEPRTDWYGEKVPLDWPETKQYLQKILHTKQRISRVEAYDISNIQGKEATGSMPVFIDGKPVKEHYRKFKIHISGKPNDFAMLREVIGRRLAHPEWPYPDLMIIDGGRGQLSSVLKAFKQYKIQDIPLRGISRRETKYPAPEQVRYGADKIHVAAIAKKHNELFLHGQSKPLLLKDMPQGVSNFILHMRDEAHRFAISYHRKLRAKELLKK